MKAIKTLNSEQLKIYFFIVLFFFLMPTPSSGSDILKYPLNKSGNSYIKASIRGQFWWRYMEMNPGSTFNEVPVQDAFDLSVRRLRATLMSQMGKRWFFYMIVGENNINKKVNSETNIRVLDLNVEYTISPQLSIGFGKTGWGGWSRWNLRSSRTLMSLDAPLFALMTVNRNDDLGRSTGLWAKGNLNDIGYVLAIKKPSVPLKRSEAEVIDYNTEKQSFSASAYIKYEFLEREGNKSAYSGSTGTYLGTKSVFNIGGGFIVQPNMMDQFTENGREMFDYVNWCMESFMDLPISHSKASITHYLGFFKSDFGPDYVRFLGANDYTSGGTTLSGSGNDVPMMGTGNTWFSQVGLFVPFSSMSQVTPKGIQPHIAVQSSDFEALGSQVWIYDLGVNLFLGGHGQKLSLGYQNRPVFEDNTSVTMRKNMFVVQYQLELR